VTAAEDEAARRLAERSDDNITLDAQDDDWAWRRRIRANPVTLAIHPYASDAAGVLDLLVATRLHLDRLGDPDRSIWATEFEWAQRLLHWGKGVLADWTHWTVRQPLWVKGLVTLATAALVLAIFWALFAITGVWSFLPDAVEDWLRRLPGVN